MPETLRDSIHEGKMSRAALEMTVSRLTCLERQMSCISAIDGETRVNLKAVVHEAEEGGFWAEVPAIPGCATQGETMDELLANLREAITGCLSVDVAPPRKGGKQRILDIAV
jgi:predicted RNase H-like HicB family nuclease